MSSPTEAIVQQEQEDFDAQQRAEAEEAGDDTPAEPTDPEPPAEPDPEDETDLPPAAEQPLFDRSQYDREGLAIAKVDGQPIDRIAVKFSGEVMLDRSSEADVALFNKLRLGGDVELRVAGKVQASTGRGATNKDGDLDVIVGSKTVRVGTVWVLDPEDL